ncbi:MAG: Uma2 family endonuclease [Microcoleaceae cyanobacterium]
MVDTQHPRLRANPNLIPPLQNGDRLIRSEFERRYEAMLELKKAELIEGIVYVSSPVRFEFHAEPHGDLMIWLGNYKVATPGVRMGDNPTVRLDLDNEPQPDALLMTDQDCGGNASLSPNGYVEGAPEFVAEIAASSASIDLGDKKRAYRRNGVQEYWVWQVFDQKINWYRLVEGDYIALEPDEQGIIRSLVFPGLWLDVTAMLVGDMPQVLAKLQQGLMSEAHQNFVDQLKNYREDL